MAGSGVRISWSSTIFGDLPPPRRPLQEVKTHNNIHDQVPALLPSFAGRYNPAAYVEWEFDVETMFARHDFPEHKRVKAATKKFVGFASIWWSEHCRTNAKNVPKTWRELKILMRGRFFPKYYLNDLLRKLQCLKQGSNTVEEYYNDLQITLFHCGLEESEDVIMDRFWDGLNCEIQELLMHENCSPMDRLFCLACKAEQEIKRRFDTKTNKHKVNIPRVESFVPATATVVSPMATTSVVVRTTPPPKCEPSSPTVPTLSEKDIYGNNKGTDDITRHEINLFPGDLNNSCVELPVDLVTPPIFEDNIAELNLPCDQILDMPAVLNAPIAAFNSSVDMSAPAEIIVAANKSCHLTLNYALDHIKLIRNDEVLARISHDNTLFSVPMDPPLSLSHARTKISGLAYLRALNSAYAPDFTFELIGDYDSNNEFWVHRICITCDELTSLKDSKIMHALSHFDMTSNIGDELKSNNLFHDYISKHLATENFENLNFCSPILGWFNDKRCKSDYKNKSFTNSCKLSCNNFMWFVSCDNSLALYFATPDNYPRMNVSYVQQLREVKMDDIYIYHVYALSIWLTMFQKKHRRGRLHFQERDDDMDTATSDTTKFITTLKHTYQVNSSNSFKIHYYIFGNKNTTPCFILRRIICDMFKPRVKMRKDFSDDALLFLGYRRAGHANGHQEMLINQT